MLANGDPAEFTRVGWALKLISAANNATWTTAAMTYIERLCFGRTGVDASANAKLFTKHYCSKVSATRPIWMRLR